MGAGSEIVEEDLHIFRSQFPPVSVPENVTLPEFVLQDAHLYSEKVAIVETATGKSYTYRDVVHEIQRFSKALWSIGIRKGHVVVVALPNLAIYPIVALGVMSAGAVFSSVNPFALDTEIKKQVEDCEAKIIVANEVAFDKVKDLGVPVITIGEADMTGGIKWDELLFATDKAGRPDIQDPVTQSDLCALPYSSGTTGTSKGVMLTHRSLVSNLCSSLAGVMPEMIGKVCVLGLIPFFHIYGITGICCSALKNKGKVVVMGRFEIRAFMDALIEHEVTFAPIVPAIMLAMVKNPIVDKFDIGKLNLKSVMSAAAPLPPDLRTAFEEKYPGVVIQEAYGMTEHSCITLTHSDPRRGRAMAKKNSVGFILPNLEVKFVDPETGISLPKNSRGEICVRSHCVMQGYYKNNEETNKTIDDNGWLHTGDIGYIDDDGDLFIVDRIKELIKYKGFQVAPAELESILHSHPSVEDAAVFALPDEEAGEIPAACVVIKEDAEESEEDIISYVAEHVASYKKIRFVKFVESIPKSASGKIMRRLLRDKYLNENK